jgi:hypothetical protein
MLRQLKFVEQTMRGINPYCDLPSSLGNEPIAADAEIILIDMA